jgi:hypothetical protein
MGSVFCTATAVTEVHGHSFGKRHLINAMNIMLPRRRYQKRKMKIEREARKTTKRRKGSKLR